MANADKAFGLRPLGNLSGTGSQKQYGYATLRLTQRRSECSMVVSTRTQPLENLLFQTTIPVQ